MTKLLLIDPDAPRAEELASRLSAEGALVKVAPSGFYALTMVERERPHLVLTRGDIGDMTGLELCAMVKRDVSLSLRVALLAGSREEGRAAASHDAFDLILEDHGGAGAVAERLLRLLRWDAESATAEKPAASPAAAPPTRSLGSLTGSLGVLSFAELTQAFSQTGKTGKLTLDSASGSGKVFFDAGQVIHAEYGEARGKEAFARLFYDCEKATSAAFRFEPMSAAEIALCPHAIDLTAPQLLLTVAVDLDEHRTRSIRVHPPDDSGQEGSS